MWKKGKALLAAVFVVSLGISGCGSQMDTAAKIQAQETVTAEELALLARSKENGVVIRAQEQWQSEAGIPAKVLQTNSGDLLLVWDCQEVPGGRKAIEAAGWAPQYYWASEDKPPIVEEMLTRFGEGEAKDYFCYPFTAKNLLIYALIPGRTVTKYSESQAALYTEVQPGNVENLRQLFWEDVNGAEADSYRAISERYEVFVGQQAYSTAMTSEGRPYYDHAVQYMMSCRLSDPEAFTPGETITVTVEGPYSGMKASMSVTLEALSGETAWVLYQGPRQWSTDTALTETPHYTVTFTSGGETETLELVAQVQAKVENTVK